MPIMYVYDLYICVYPHALMHTYLSSVLYLDAHNRLDMQVSSIRMVKADLNGIYKGPAVNGGKPC